MMRTCRYVMVGKGELQRALDTGDKKEAEKVFAETTKRYEALYSAEDRGWFANCALKFFNRSGV